MAWPESTSTTAKPGKTVTMAAHEHQPLRVLHVYKTYPPDDFTACRVSFMRLCEGMAPLGVTSTVLALSKKYGGTVQRVDGHTVHFAKQDINIASAGLSLSAFGPFSAALARDGCRQLPLALAHGGCPAPCRAPQDAHGRDLPFRHRAAEEPAQTLCAGAGPVFARCRRHRRDLAQLSGKQPRAAEIWPTRAGLSRSVSPMLPQAIPSASSAGGRNWARAFSSLSARCATTRACNS